MDIHIENQQSDLSLPSQAIQSLVIAVLAFEELYCDEISIYLVDKQKISDLHAQFFDDASPTDCISFPMDTPRESEISLYPCVLGEVFVCPKVALEYAEVHQGDPYREVTLYIIHGLLHLIGYDDLETDKRLEMRAAEERHLNHLDSQNFSLQRVVRHQP